MNILYMLSCNTGSAWQFGEVSVLLESGACELGDTEAHTPWADFGTGYSVSRICGRYCLSDAEGRIRSSSKTLTRGELRTLARMAAHRMSVA
jgi:hypothetical protein